MQSVCILAQDQYGNYVIQVFLYSLETVMYMFELQGLSLVIFSINSCRLCISILLNELNPGKCASCQMEMLFLKKEKKIRFCFMSGHIVLTR